MSYTQMYGYGIFFRMFYPSTLEQDVPALFMFHDNSPSIWNLLWLRFCLVVSNVFEAMYGMLISSETYFFLGWNQPHQPPTSMNPLGNLVKIGQLRIIAPNHPVLFFLPAFPASQNAPASQDGAGVTGQPGPRGYGWSHLRLQRGVALEHLRGFKGTTLEVGGGQRAKNPKTMAGNIHI